MTAKEDKETFEEFKNFTNKIWNGARFILMNLEGDEAKDLAEEIKGTLATLDQCSGRGM